MPKEDIVEGLKIALARGETLPKAMMSFYNSGYPKEDIEDAARMLQNNQYYQQTQPTQQAEPTRPTPQIPKTPVLKPVPAQPQFQNPVVKPVAPPEPKVIMPEREEYTPQAPNEQRVVQRVSSYDSKNAKPSKAATVMIFMLVFLLLALLGALIALFLFKNEITAFFNTLGG